MKKFLVICILIFSILGNTSAATFSGGSMVGGVINVFSPTQISGLVLWLRSDLGITKDGGNLVSAWADQSGNGNNATAYGSPLWKDNHINGHSTIYLNGSTDYFLANLVATKGYFSGIDKPMSIFIVATMEKVTFDDAYNGTLASVNSSDPNGANEHIFRFYNYGLNMQIDRWDDAFNQKTGTGDGIPYEPITYARPHLWELVFTGTTVSIYRDGGATVTAADLDVGTAALDTYFSIGVIKENAAPFYYWIGDITEVIVYNSDLSDANRQSVELYINTKAQGTGYAIY